MKREEIDNSIKVLDQPKVLAYDDLQPNYVMGKYLLVCKERDRFRIIAEADIDMPYHKAIREFKKIWNEDEDYNVIKIDKLEREHFHEVKVMSRYEFLFGDTYESIEKTFKKINNVWGIGSDEFYLYVSENYSADTVKYLGYSTSNYIESNETEGKNIPGYMECMDFALLKRMKKDYADCHRMPEHEDRVEEKTKLEYQIGNWLKKTSYKAFENALTSRIKGQEEAKKVAANTYNYFYRIANNIKTNNALLLIAPSGCGKSETYRFLRDYFSKELPGLPFMQVDMSALTEAGYKGANVDEVIKKRMLQLSEDGIMVVFLDEFDKKVNPSYGSNGINYNKAVQRELLSIIEGIELSDGETTFDTSRTLFIAAGSFNQIRENKSKTQNKIGIGSNMDEETKEHFSYITREDIIELGGEYELIGRFPFVVNYGKLSDKAVDEIINSNVKELRQAYTIDFTISKNARQQLHGMANTEYGCRMIRSKLQEAIIPFYMDAIATNSQKKYCVQQIA